MRTSPYSQIARSAAQCEEFGNLSEAAVLWHQATELAVRKANRDWSAHRANVCETRLRLAAKPLPEKPERRGLAKLAFAGPRR